MMVWTWIYNLMKERMSLLKADVITAVEFRQRFGTCLELLDEGEDGFGTSA